MHRKIAIAAALSAVLALGAMPSQAQEAPVAIYGADLMTEQEKQEYLRELQACRTPEELAAFRMEHYHMISQRALQRGATISDWAGYDDTPDGPIIGLGDIVYGWRFMSDTERDAHIAKLASLPTAEDQLDYLVAHHAQMMARAREARMELVSEPGPYGYEIYGVDLMTPEEVQQYREELAGLKTEAERERFYREHQMRIQARAQDELAGISDWGGNSMTGSGIGLGDMIYGWRLMTEQEYQDNVEKLRALPSAEDQVRFIIEVHEAMQQRALSRGIRLPEVPAPFWYYAIEKGK